MADKKISELVRKGLEGYERQDVVPDYMDDDVIFVEGMEMLPKVYSTKLYANIFCFCIAGRMELDVNGTHYVLREHETLVCPSGVTVANTLVSPDFKFAILCLTDRIIQSMLSVNVDIWNRAVYMRKEHIVQPTGGTEGKRRAILGHHFFQIMKSLLEAKDNPFREEMVRAMLQMSLLGYCSRLKEKEDASVTLTDTEKRSPQSMVIFNKFMALLRNEQIKHQPVYYFAEKLCISSKYLSHVCKEVSGKSANEFIQTAVVDEIVHYLKNTSLSVKEIANAMNFPNISFFGKYVKSHLGVSPNEFRRQLYSAKG